MLTQVCRRAKQISGVLMIVDVRSIVKTSMELAKKEPSEAGKRLRQTAKSIEEEITKIEEYM